MLGALTAYAVVVGGGLQLADIVVHALDLPPWVLRALLWTAAVGLPITLVVSWFFDLTRRGFVRTVAPASRSAPSPSFEAAEAGARRAQAAAALQALEPGATLAGRYRIERELGQGGMGRVLAAEDQRLGRRVAIKVVTGAHDPARLRRFEQEARTAGALDHPNVVAIFDLGEQDGIPFLVTELLDGHTLRSVIDGGPLPPEQVQGLALQLARGLAAAHAAGILHRDLKPENLFLTRDGRLKILDFGMAKLLGPEGGASGPGLTLTGVLFGSPGYLSPEQARGEKPDAASDVFGAGAILYELLSGRRAFPGGSLVEAGHAAITLTPPPLPEGVPPALSQVVFRALEKSPKARFADGAALLGALEKVGGLTPTPVNAGRGRARRLSTVAMAAITLVAVGAAIYSAVRIHPHAVANPASTEAGPEDGGGVDRGTGQAPPSWNPRNRDRARPELGTVPVPPAPPSLPGKPKSALPVALPPGVLSPSDLAQLEQLSAQKDEMPAAAMPGLVGGAHALEQAGQLQSAKQMIEKYLGSHPEDLRAQLELAAMQRRHGETALATRRLAKLSRTLPRTGFLPTLVRLFAGQASESDVWVESRSKDPDEATERKTQALYYLGLLHESATPPDTATALRDFQAAAHHPEVVEGNFAETALSRLGKADE